MKQDMIKMTEQDEQNCIDEGQVAMTKLCGIASRSPTLLAGVMVVLSSILGRLEALARHNFMNTGNVRSALQIAVNMLDLGIQANNNGDTDIDRLYERMLVVTSGESAQTAFVGDFEGHLVLATLERCDDVMQWGLVRLILDDGLMLDNTVDGFIFGTVTDPHSSGHRAVHHRREIGGLSMAEDRIPADVRGSPRGHIDS